MFITLIHISPCPQPPQIHKTTEDHAPTPGAHLF